MPEINPYEAPQSEPPRSRKAWFLALAKEYLGLAFELQIYALVLVLFLAQISFTTNTTDSAHYFMLRVYAGIVGLGLLVIAYALATKEWGRLGFEAILLVITGLGFLEWLPRIHWN